jgi:phosphatidyl-myo-inositol dimannoside synthase
MGKSSTEHQMGGTWMRSDAASDLRHVEADENLYRTSERVLLLSPSRGLGGGIERYIETLEWAFVDQKITSQRVDLNRPGLQAHLRMLADGRTLLRASPKRTRLVVGHRTLMPVATLLAREPMVSGISILCYGSDVWNERHRVRKRVERALMRKPGVRVVAISSFTAGALASDCQSTILRPALSQKWFETLVAASTAGQRKAQGVQLATAFRIADWRNKGLPQLIEAIKAQRRQDIQLTICGSGEPPPDLLRLIAGHDWCTLLVGLTDSELAVQLASADLFVLATRTRIGRRPNGEGFGLVLLEAQIAGTPVIAPAYGGSPDAYMDGITGVAPVNESAEALARSISDMLEDPVRLTLMRKHAAQWARESFAPESYPRLVVGKLL